MTSRTDVLIADLKLEPHPEGGHFREVFRSASRVRPEDGRGDRDALTTIFFLLREGEFSRFHRVWSDEIWHFYEGEPLDLMIVRADFSTCERIQLGPLTAGGNPVAVVAAGDWQAAVPRGAYALVGCSVGPGFDFGDFSMLTDLPEEAERLRRRYPDVAALL